MQAAEGSSRRRSLNGRVAEDEGDAMDRLDKLAESSIQATSRRLSNGNSKGKEKVRTDDDVRLEELDTKADDSEPDSLYDSDDESLHCAICLSVIDDRTVVQPCCHDAYCFVCILAWTEQSRRCPLCVANIELLVHNIRSEKDYQKHYLPPLLKSDSPPPKRSFRELREGARQQLFNRPTHPRFKYAEWRARNEPAALPEVDAEDLALEKRRYVYKYGLYAKHVATNRFTRFRDYSAQQVSSNPELKQRLQKWLRRELRVFDGVDLAFLVDYCTNVASQLELRSDSATRLLAEFIGEEQAEQFWHETYSFLRSPYKDIRQYDKAIQYDRPPRRLGEIKEDKSSPRPATTRRARSPSVSSLSNAESIGDRPAARRDSIGNRRYSKRSDRPPPPSRREGDSYIPSYSKLNKTRPPPRKRVDRRVSRGDRVRAEVSSRHAYESRASEPQSPRVQEAAPSLPAPTEAPAREDSDDGGISLGESDYESAPLVTPKDDTYNTNKTMQANQVRQSALSIRGLAQARPTVNENGKEVDVIRDLGPDLLSRLSGSRSESNAHNSPARSSSGRLLHSQANSSAGIQMKGRGFRKGKVNSEMHANLMARLSEEKLRSGSASPVSIARPQGTSASEKSEASLREDVLQVLKERRQNTERSVSHTLKVAARQVEAHPTPTSAQTGDKSSKFALLQSRLAAERAAISPPVPSPPISIGQPSTALPSARSEEETKETGSAVNPADRMAELKRRLAEQKAARGQA